MFCAVFTRYVCTIVCGFNVQRVNQKLANTPSVATIPWKWQTSPYVRFLYAVICDGNKLFIVFFTFCNIFIQEHYKI